MQTINIGGAPNDGTGDPLRTAFGKINSNSGEIIAVAWAGTLAASQALVVAGAALSTAWAGTNAAAATSSIAVVALNTSWSGTSAAANAGVTASAALTTAWAGTTTANAIATTDAGVAGDGAGIHLARSGNNLPLKRIKAGANITITDAGTNIVIASAGTSGGAGATGVNYVISNGTFYFLNTDTGLKHRFDIVGSAGVEQTVIQPGE